jgi:predicted metal-dependent hydrolase
VTENQVITANIHKGFILMNHLPFGENIEEIRHINVRYSVFMSVTQTPYTVAITTAITAIMLATHMIMLSITPDVKTQQHTKTDSSITFQFSILLFLLQK